MYKEDKFNPFADDDTGADLDVHGSLDIPFSGNKVARPVGLDEIRPDLKQPRRAIPQKVRGDWNGNPAKIRDLLMKWKIQCQMQTGKQVDDLGDVLTGMAELPDEYEDYPGIVGAWVELIRLAQRIYAEGLQNPITIYNEGGQKFILTGERRYLAHWLLRLEVDREQWSKIPAQVVSYSVRQQISENTARRDLNAVGLARCYAMIVMELYREEGKAFKAFADVVRPGECDRAYYAQVADMQAPYGKAGEVMSALNLKSRAQLKKYKDLLTVPDVIWMQADDEEWSLNRLMDWLEAQKPQPVRENVHRSEHFKDEKSPTPPQTVAPVRSVPPVREDQWDDDEDMRSYAPVIPQGVRRDDKTGLKWVAPDVHEHPAPPVLEDARYLITDTEIEAVVAMAAKIAEHREDMPTWEVISWLVGLDMNEMARYGADRARFAGNVEASVDAVAEIFEELIERLRNWQIERIMEEFEDMSDGLR